MSADLVNLPLGVKMFFYLLFIAQTVASITGIAINEWRIRKQKSIK